MLQHRNLLLESDHALLSVPRQISYLQYEDALKMVNIFNFFCGYKEREMFGCHNLA